MTLATVKTAKTSAQASAKTGAKPVAKSPKGKTATVTKIVPKSTATPKANLKAATKPLPKAAAKAAPAPVVQKIEAKTEVRVEPKIVARVPAKSTRTTIMTEAELIKQPKGEYMSGDQLAFFRQRLMSLQKELRDNAGATTEHLRELAVAPDPADRATLEEEHALELRARDRERKLLKKVEGALMRIDSGDYGYCEETGEPIGILRLLARPTATLTIEAQERRELKQKMYGE
jgi:DnaK suppressor protein